MTNKEKILLLYFEHRLNPTQISNKLKVSKSYVTKIIKTDTRYKNEKIRRKNETVERHKQQKREFARKKRQIKKQERLDAAIALQHAQASFELSGRKTINNRAFKKWNSSIYGYYNKTKEFRLKKDFENKVSYAVPKKIKWN